MILQGGPLVTVDSNSICVEKMVHVKENVSPYQITSIFYILVGGWLRNKMDPL